jgi:hypothetical protein
MGLSEQCGRRFIVYLTANSRHFSADAAGQALTASATA